MQQQAAMQPSVAIDPYAQYLQENAAALQGPYLPQDQYAAPTREEYQKYFIEGQAPSKAVLVNPPVQRTAMPATQQVQQAQPGAIPMPAEAPQEAMAAPQPRQQGPMTIGQRIAALPYEGDRIEATYKLVEQTRQKVFNEEYQKIVRAYANPNDIASAVKNLKEQIDVNLPMPKRVEESPQYKAAEKNWDGGLRDRQKRLVSAYNVVKESQKLMDVDPEKATIFMRQAMIKPLQSIISSEALQVSDLLVQFQDLLNTPSFAQLTGKKITNPSILFNKYLSLEDRDKGTFRENLVKAMVEANPGRALENAVLTVNSYLDGYNKDINDQVIFPTSPTIARQLGAVQFQPLENRQVKNDLPETYSGQPVQSAPQAVPFGAPPPGAVRIKQR
jgi:hypothetical protein